MTDSEQRKTFADNLNRLLEATGKSQKEVADAINVIPQTFNTWCTGQAIPRMGKIQKLADYFGVKKSELIEKKDLPMSSSASSTVPLAPREQDLVKFYRGVGPSAQDYLYNKAKLLYTDALIERDAPTIGGIAAYGGDSDAIIQTKDQQKKAEEFWRKQNQKNRKD